jgi:hypothetical protein
MDLTTLMQLQMPLAISLTTDAEPSMILALIDKYGFAVVAAVLLAIALWRLIQKMEKRNEMLDGTLNQMLTTILQQKKSPSQFNQQLLLQTEMSMRIETFLCELAETLNADRAWVTQFHNGGQLISGIPFLYQTRTHEICRNGVLRQLHNYQHMSVSYTSWRCNKIAKHETIIIDDIENFSENEQLQLKSEGIQAAITLGIYDTQGNPLGYIGVDFVLDKPEITQGMVSVVNRAAGRIEVGIQELMNAQTCGRNTTTS